MEIYLVQYIGLSFFLEHMQLVTAPNVGETSAQKRRKQKKEEKIAVIMRKTGR
jgi:hypothetical protein